MHFHILGIGGTFMAGLALLAREQGHQISGCDQAIYPPMSDQLMNAGIVLHEGYDDSQLDNISADFYIVGNAMRRGMPVIERLLNEKRRYLSGPQWLADFVLPNRTVLAVAGTHGKTTTTSILSWILQFAELTPGFLIGGIPENFGVSARLGNSPYFVLEADEYDSAFFDKRAKFIHYQPKFLLLNNLEFDHGDIYSNLAAIQKQFHHLIRTVPANGRIIYPDADINLETTLGMGCWTPLQTVGGDWQATDIADGGQQFTVLQNGKKVSEVHWPLLGIHNINNGLGAIAMAYAVGVTPQIACEALTYFRNVKRRLELKGIKRNVAVYDDFAHHPTAISATIKAIKSATKGRVIAVLEPRSNTMRMGHFRQELGPSLHEADYVFLYQAPDLPWDLQTVLETPASTGEISRSVNELINRICQTVRPEDAVLVMSNGSFEGIHERLLSALGS